MTNKTIKIKGTNMGFLGFLTLLFIGLKLGHVIAWSWAWVLSPIWAPLVFAGFIILFVLICAIIGK